MAIKGQINLADVATNPLRVRPPEGQGFAVMKANSNGPLDRFVMSYRGHHFRIENPNAPAASNEWELWDVLADGTYGFHPKKGLNRVLKYLNPASILGDDLGLVNVGLNRARQSQHTLLGSWSQESDL